MKSNSRSYRRHRNPEIAQKKSKPFFASSQKEPPRSGNAFFQPKLAMGEAGDKYEREADAVADKAVNRSSDRQDAAGLQQVTAVNGMSQKKEEASTIQRQDAPKEEEKPVQKKDEPIKKEEEKPVQKMDAPDKKEEEKPVQKKDDPLKKEEEKPVQKMDAPDKKEEEKPVQKKDDPLKKEEEKPVQKMDAPDKKEEEKPSVMAKAENSSMKNSENLAGRLEQLNDRGNPLPSQLNNEMGNSIGADFSGVNIHTDNESSELNKQIGAQAFTHGNNIYFNEGKYNPQTAAGKHLLAHELTHVVQQGAAPQARTPLTSGHAASPSHVQRETSTPLPEGVTANKKSKVGKFKAGGFSIIIKPDKKAQKSNKKVKPDSALTTGNINAGYTYTKDKGKIVSVTISKKLVIQTTYGVNAGSEMDSAYGRGSIKKDKEAGHGTLGFHEGSHGTDFIEYVKTNPYPEIQITEPLTKQEFKELVKEWKQQCRQYQADMEATSKQQTDDVTDP